MVVVLLFLLRLTYFLFFMRSRVILSFCLYFVPLIELNFVLLFFIDPQVQMFIILIPFVLLLKALI